MKRSHRVSLQQVCVIALLFAFACPAFAQAPAPTQPNSGHVDGSKYSNSFFGFTYRIPEAWALRSTAGRVPDGYLLLSLKPKESPDPLSAIMITAAQLPASYGGEVLPFLLDHYRLTQSTGQGLVINGISTGRKRLRPGVPEPEVVGYADRTFYRIQFETPGVSRMVIGTAENGYALMFEVAASQRRAEQSLMEFTESLHGLTFKTPAPTQSQTK